MSVGLEMIRGTAKGTMSQVLILLIIICVKYFCPTHVHGSYTMSFLIFPVYGEIAEIAECDSFAVLQRHLFGY